MIALMLGSSFLALFLKFKDLTDEEKDDLRTLMLFGPFSGPWINRHKTRPLATDEERAAYFALRDKIMGGKAGPITKEQYEQGGLG